LSFWQEDPDRDCTASQIEEFVTDSKIRIVRVISKRGDDGANKKLQCYNHCEEAAADDEVAEERLVSPPASAPSDGVAWLYIAASADALDDDRACDMCISPVDIRAGELPGCDDEGEGIEPCDWRRLRFIEMVSFMCLSRSTSASTDWRRACSCSFDL